MRNLNLTNYVVQVSAADGEGTVDRPFAVCSSLITLIFSIGSTALEVLRRDDLARKLEAADTSIWLEEEEFALLEKAIDQHESFDRFAVPLIRRIKFETPAVDASQVPVPQQE